MVEAEGGIVMGLEQPASEQEPIWQKHCLQQVSAQS